MLFSIVLVRGHQTTAHEPDPAQELILSGLPHFVETKAKLQLLRKKRLLNFFAKLWRCWWRCFIFVEKDSRHIQQI